MEERNIKIIKSPGEYCFIGNSVVLGFELDTADPVSFDVSAGVFSTSLSDYPHKSGNIYKLEVDFKDILASFFVENYSILNTDQLVSVVDNFTLNYSIRVQNKEIFKGKALRGGISKALIKYLSRNHFDIFTYKILNSFSQFLFTTRTLTSMIPIRESELSIILFLHPGTNLRFTSSGLSIDVGRKQAKVPCSMNLRGVYNEFLLKQGVAPHLIEVYSDSILAFSFKIIPSQVSEYQYAIRFKNSLGVFEIIEVTGKPYQRPEFGEENKYQERTDFGNFEERRSRVQHVDILEVETGYKTRQEHSFAIDMIKSDEIYFQYPNGIEQRCHVTAEDLKYEERLTITSSIKLKVRMVDSEEFFGSSLDINTQLDGRTFDDTFDETFY